LVHLRSRTQEAAHAVVHTLKDTLNRGCGPVVTSDGLRLHFYALTAHFGYWVAQRGQRVWHVADSV
jgi:hypothetical protein